MGVVFSTTGAVLAGAPQFLAGLVLLLIGVVAGGILQRAVEGLLRLLMLERWVEKARIGKAADMRLWQTLVGQVVRWAVVILFLVPALEAWGIPGVTEVLNEL